MQLEAMMFANAAAIDEKSLLAVQGAGWESYDVEMFPATISGFVAGILALDRSQHGEAEEMTLDILDDDGQVVGSSASIIASGIRPETTEGVPYRFPFAIPFMTAARGPTVVKARLTTTGDVELGVISFALRGGMPDAPPEDL